MNTTILLRYGEIYLKGQNRPFFERKLLENIKKSVEGFEGITVNKAQGRFYIDNASDNPQLKDRLTKIFGIISLSPALKVEKSLEAIKEAAFKAMEEAIEKRGTENITFKVETRRSDKKFFMDSMSISREIGAYLLDNFPQLSVDVHKPQVTIYIEVREWAYVYHEIIPAAGGMPVGTNGKATLLLSGGIDSPVAGWMIAKRGVALSAVHYHSYPYTSDRAKQKVIDLCNILTDYCGPIRLYVVPFTEIQQQLYQKCPDSQLTVLMRRFMMKIAEIIANKEKSKALITGESIGQVASQTLESLVVTNSAVNMPVLRPLIGFDKVEIIDVANKIATYETSILPYEDCCTIFVPKHPVTHPNLESVVKAEEIVDGEALIKNALDGVEVIDIGV